MIERLPTTFSISKRTMRCYDLKKKTKRLLSLEQAVLIIVISHPELQKEP